MLPPFFLFLFLLLSFASFAQEQEPLPTGTLTVRQYAEFLQCTAATDRYGLYNEKMGDDLLSACIIRNGTPGSYTYEAVSERLDDPVPYVSRLSAKRYCNWLQNGLPTGEQDETTTEKGAYTLDGTMEEDPAREENATYFLSTSANNEIDLTLASNLTTYMIVTHFGDSFQFSSNSSSQDSREGWTIGGVITGIIGIAAVTYRGGILCAEEEYHDNDFFSSEQREAQDRRNVELETPSPYYEMEPVFLTKDPLKAATTVKESREIKGGPSPVKVVTSSLEPPPFSIMRYSPSASWKNPIPVHAGSSTSSSASPKARAVQFNVGTINHYLSDDTVALSPNEFLHPLSDRFSPLQKPGTRCDASRNFIMFDKKSDSPTRRQAKRDYFNSKIGLFIESQIAACDWIDSDKQVFFKKILSHFDFFNETTNNLTDEQISQIRACNPSFFYNPNLPFWEDLQDRKKFFIRLHQMHQDPELEDPEKMQRTIKDLISRRTILFEASEAIDAWKNQIQATQWAFESLLQNFSVSAFTALAQTTFDHLFDFHNYIDSLVVTGTPIYHQTYSLTPVGMESLKKDKKSIEQWVTDFNETLPADLEEKFASLNKAINTLSHLYDHNFNEALRFLKFKEQQDQKRMEEAALIAAAQQTVSCSSTSSRDNSFSTQGHTDPETSPVPSFDDASQIGSTFNKLLKTGKHATGPYETL